MNSLQFHMTYITYKFISSINSMCFLIGVIDLIPISFHKCNTLQINPKKLHSSNEMIKKRQLEGLIYNTIDSQK